MAVKNITDFEFQTELKDNNTVFIKFFADWCGSCRLMAPKVKKWSEDEKYSGIKFIEVDAEKNPGARKWAAVSNLPFFATVKNGQLVEGISASKEERITAMLDKLKAE